MTVGLFNTAVAHADDVTTTKAFDQTHRFPDHNGDFSAMLAIIPEQQLVEFEKPSHEGLRLTRVSRVQVGAKLAVKFLFAGIMADSNNNIEVSYDLKIMTPDGKTYGSSDYHHLEAIRGSRGDKNGVYDNRKQVVMLSFDPQDTAGTYTLLATLRDEVSELEIPLSATIELLSDKAAASEPADETAANQIAPLSKAVKADKKHLVSNFGHLKFWSPQILAKKVIP